jgi:hypothetical protein
MRAALSSAAACTGLTQSLLGRLCCECSDKSATQYLVVPRQCRGLSQKCHCCSAASLSLPRCRRSSSPMSLPALPVPATRASSWIRTRRLVHCSGPSESALVSLFWPRVCAPLRQCAIAWPPSVCSGADEPILALSELRPTGITVGRRPAHRIALPTAYGNRSCTLSCCTVVIVIPTPSRAARRRLPMHFASWSRYRSRSRQRRDEAGTDERERRKNIFVSSMHRQVLSNKVITKSGRITRCIQL